LDTLKQAIPFEQRSLLTIQEAGAYLPASRARIYQLLNQKLITGRKFGSRTLIERASLDKFIDSLPGY
jgi:excisionase family DNA binding protein